MKKYLPACFMIIGAIDLIYGILRTDMVSLFIGPLMVGLAVYTMIKERNHP
jgi:hypothetical protein